MKIDPEFKVLIAPLQPDELAQLEANLVAEGCRDPLVTWRGTLVDGHNRFEICERHGISYRTVEVALDTREHVKIWIEENQLGRRNLTDDQRAAIALSLLKRRTTITKSQRAKQGGRGNKGNLGDTVSPKFSERIRPAVAQTAQVPERKLRALLEIEKCAGSQAVAQIRAGHKTIIETKREIRDHQRAEIREANQRLVQQTPSLSVALGDQTFSTIVIDPPWDYSEEDGDGDQFGRTRPIYSVMSLDELLALPIDRFAEQNAHIYLWITNRSLPKGFALLEKWGFRHVTALTWCKPSIGIGTYFRGSTEHVLFGVRGSLPLLRNNVGTWFNAPRPGDHSAKPAEFYALVESCSPGPWLEVFARQSRPGWAVWGAEAICSGPHDAEQRAS